MKPVLINKMKSIVLDPLRCNGCLKCETACSVRRTGLNRPAWSCIRVIGKDGMEGFWFPVVCLQCSDPPCLKVCPAEAIFRDESDRVMIRYDRCIGCRMCLFACPFGAMIFDADLGRSFKCDLCGGDPECVRVCEPKALHYLDRNEIGQPRIQAFSRSLLEAERGR